MSNNDSHMHVTEHVKSNASVYVNAGVALVVSLAVNITVITRWGTQLEERINYHVTQPMHSTAPTPAKIEEMNKEISEMKSDLKLIMYRLGIVEHPMRGEPRRQQYELKIPQPAPKQQKVEN